MADVATALQIIAALAPLAQGAIETFGPQQQPQQINPFTADFMQMLGQNQENLNAQLQAALSGQGAALGEAGGLAGQLAGFQPQAQYDPQAAFREFLGRQPALQDIAREAVSPFQQDAAGLAREQAAQALSQVQEQFGGSGGLLSGAELQAATQATIAPRLQAQAQANQQFQNMLGGLMGTERQATAQEQATNLQAQQFADQMRQSGLGQALQGQLGIAGQYGGQQSLFGNMLNNILAQQGQLAAPVYFNPQQGNFGSGVGATMTNLGALAAGQPAGGGNALLQEILKALGLGGSEAGGITGTAPSGGGGGATTSDVFTNPLS